MTQPFVGDGTELYPVLLVLGGLAVPFVLGVIAIVVILVLFAVFNLVMQ